MRRVASLLRRTLTIGTRRYDSLSGVETCLLTRRQVQALHIYSWSLEKFRGSKVRCTRCAGKNQPEMSPLRLEIQQKSRHFQLYAAATRAANLCVGYRFRTALNWRKSHYLWAKNGGVTRFIFPRLRVNCADGYGPAVRDYCTFECSPCTSVHSAHCCELLSSPYDANQNRWRTEINETRLYASFPPYLDVAIVFCSFVWAGMVGRTCYRASDGLDAGWFARRRTSRFLVDAERLNHRRVWNERQPRVSEHMRHR